MTMSREDIYMRAERFLFSWKAKRDGLQEAEKYTRFVESIQVEFAASELAAAREEGAREERKAMKAELTRRINSAHALALDKEIGTRHERAARITAANVLIKAREWLDEREKEEAK